MTLDGGGEGGNPLDLRVLELFGPGVRFQGTYYQNDILTGNLALPLRRRQGSAPLLVNFAEEAPTGGGPLVVGLSNGMNTYGASNGWTQRQWVNPPGYYLAQLPATWVANIGSIDSTADTPPHRGLEQLRPTTTPPASAPAPATTGPQTQQTFGGSVTQRFRWTGEDGVLLGAEYGHSDYRSNRNSHLAPTAMCCAPIWKKGLC